MLNGSHYSVVTSTIALIIAVGLGGAYAAEKLGSNDIKTNAIRSKHVKRGQIKSADVSPCPAGTRAFAGSCWEEDTRASVIWVTAVDVCAARDGVLPQAGDLAAFSRRPGITLATTEWSGEFMTSDPGGDVIPVFVGESHLFGGSSFTTERAYRCVLPRLP